MADQGPFLTSCIIFYLSIGAAVFQILEEQNWISARDEYILQKDNVLRKYSCLTKEDLDDILRIVSEAAGQGVTITGEKHRNTWDWVNSVIFAASIVTTIGYGNVAPKTKGGRVFCILYGLCGIPLCLVWISELGSFFGDRAKRLSQVLIRKGVSVKKVQVTCTALFLLWGLLLHLVIPPFVFMSVEGWTYLEGIYFSFITLTTVGFGDYVAGVNPNIEYPSLYRTFAELWIYMGLAWLSLFFSWNVHMVVKAHQKFKQRRHRYRNLNDEEPQHQEEEPKKDARPSIIDIFNFLSEKDEDYSTVIKEIGIKGRNRDPKDQINRSKSCSDILAIRTLDHSPGRKPIISISQVFLSPNADAIQGDQKQGPAAAESHPPEGGKRDGAAAEDEDGCVFDPDTGGITITVPASVRHPGGGETRFTIAKVKEVSPMDNDENG